MLNDSNTVSKPGALGSNRAHSPLLVADTKRWVEAIDFGRVVMLDDQRTDWTARLSRIAAEGSYYGFTRLVRLCRCVNAALLSHSSGRVVLSPPQKASLANALQAIAQAVAVPASLSIDLMQTLVQELYSSFKLTADDVSEPLMHEVEIAAGSNATPSANPDQSLEHRDLEVYQSSRLDSLDHCLEEESWIVSQLAALAEDLASGTHTAHPSARLMHVLRGHKFFNNVDRVCLVGRVAKANQLVVVDASISDRCQENTLKKGYSCFVNPEGSLFKMRPGTVRVFANSERVLGSFSDQGKPAQRSIALISDQGLRSGLCLAIGRGTEIQGFLFLNSVQDDLFKTITISSAPLLSLFGLVATIALDTSGFHISPSPTNVLTEHLPNASTVFEKSQFSNWLAQSLAVLDESSSLPGVEVIVNQDASHFLYLPTTIVSTVAEVVFRLGLQRHATGKTVTMQVVRDGLEMQLKLEHGRQSSNAKSCDWLDRTVRLLNSTLINKPVKIKLIDSQVVVAFAFEPLLTGFQELRYSVVY